MRRVSFCYTPMLGAFTSLRAFKYTMKNGQVLCGITRDRADCDEKIGQIRILRRIVSCRWRGDHPAHVMHMHMPRTAEKNARYERFSPLFAACACAWKRNAPDILQRKHEVRGSGFIGPDLQRKPRRLPQPDREGGQHRYISFVSVPGGVRTLSPSPRTDEPFGKHRGA